MIETLHTILVNAEARSDKSVEENLQTHFMVAAWWYN